MAESRADSSPIQVEDGQPLACGHCAGRHPVHTGRRIEGEPTLQFVTCPTAGITIVGVGHEPVTPRLIVAFHARKV